MKKFCALFALGVILLAGCNNNADKDKLAQDSAVIAEQESQLRDATNFNDSLMLLMGDIYTGLDSINQQEGLLYNMGAGDNVNRREEIRQNLSALKSRLSANRALLEQLEERAKSAEGNNVVLQRTIAQLKTYVANKDKQIAELEGKLKEANVNIENLNGQVAQGKEQLAQANEATDQARAQAVAAENEANVCYYVIGSNKELKQNGFLEKKFLGQTKVMKGNFNSSYMTKADRRTLNSIPTNGKKVKIWTNMPASSYEIAGASDGPKTIRILDKAAFWSLSPVLVVQVDN